jgi:hypothetical protein
MRIHRLLRRQDSHNAHKPAFQRYLQAHPKQQITSLTALQPSRIFQTVL